MAHISTVNGQRISLHIHEQRHNLKWSSQWLWSKRAAQSWSSERNWDPFRRVGLKVMDNYRKRHSAGEFTKTRTTKGYSQDSSSTKGQPVRRFDVAGKETNVENHLKMVPDQKTYTSELLRPVWNARSNRQIPRIIPEIPYILYPAKTISEEERLCRKTVWHWFRVNDKEYPLQ